MPAANASCQCARPPSLSLPLWCVHLTHPARTGALKSPKKQLDDKSDAHHKGGDSQVSIQVAASIKPKDAPAAAGSSSRWAGLHTNAGSMRTLNKKAAAKLNSFRDPLGAAIKALEDNLKGLHEEDEDDDQDEAMAFQEQGRAPVEDHVEVYQSLAAAFDSHLAAASEPSKQEPPKVLLILSDFASNAPVDKWHSMFRALAMLLISRDHLLVVDQLQVGFQKGQWTVVYDGPLNTGAHLKNTTTLVVELVLNACRTASLPVRDKMNNTVGFLELFAALTVAKT
eukprot:Tamp_18947.p1 GENE.Tamp_18947~~Tamp_18947.p1  ORF type:complete len:283 (+),score=42.17 Tamp_18947:40-888(+)